MRKSEKLKGKMGLCEQMQTYFLAYSKDNDYLCSRKVRVDGPLRQCFFAGASRLIDEDITHY